MAKATHKITTTCPQSAPPPGFGSGMSFTTWYALIPLDAAIPVYAGSYDAARAAIAGVGGYSLGCSFGFDAIRAADSVCRTHSIEAFHDERGHIHTV